VTLYQTELRSLLNRTSDYRNKTLLQAILMEPTRAWPKHSARTRRKERIAYQP
jgi:hypothetical protein